MKPTLLFATLSMALASPSVFAKPTEIEVLRSRCLEQERQIRMLEDENAELRNAPREKRVASRTETISAVIGKSVETPVSSSSASTSSIYTVKAGDSFGKIARKVGTSPEKLAKANGLKMSSVIRPGQKLKVVGSVASVEKATESKTALASQPVKQISGTHKVLPGDTYSSISKKHGVSTAALIAANPKMKPSALRPGQLVNLGSSSSTMMVSAPSSKPKTYTERAPEVASKAPAKNQHQNIPVSMTTAPAHHAPTQPAAAPAAAPAQAASAPAPDPSHTPEKKIRPVTIEGETTYGEFATKHGTDTDRLNALNGLDLNTATVLAKGSELYVPAQP